MMGASTAISPEKTVQEEHNSIVKLHKLERIPILRKEDDYRFMGNLVYRSFAPRSS